MEVLTFIACPTLEYSHIRSYLEQLVWYHTAGLNSKFPPSLEAEDKSAISFNTERISRPELWAYAVSYTKSTLYFDVHYVNIVVSWLFRRNGVYRNPFYCPYIGSYV